MPADGVIVIYALIQTTQLFAIGCVQNLDFSGDVEPVENSSEFFAVFRPAPVFDIVAAGGFHGGPFFRFL